MLRVRARKGVAREDRGAAVEGGNAFLGRLPEMGWGYHEDIGLCVVFFDASTRLDGQGKEY